MQLNNRPRLPARAATGYLFNKGKGARFLCRISISDLNGTNFIGCCMHQQDAAMGARNMALETARAAEGEDVNVDGVDEVLRYMGRGNSPHQRRRQALGVTGTGQAKGKSGGGDWAHLRRRP